MIKQVLENCKLRFRYLLTTDELIDSAVSQLGEHKIVAWMQGRMEFGPRALGNRSLLASPLESVLDREPERVRETSRDVPQVRRFGARGDAPAEYFEACPSARFLATVGRVQPAYRERFRRRSSGDRIASTPWSRRQPALLAPAPRCRQSPPACPCSTIRPSTCSATRWSHASRRRPQLLFVWHRRAVRREFLPEK